MKRLVVALLGVVCVAVFGARWIGADTSKELTAEDGRHFLHDVHKPYLAKIKIDVEDSAQCKVCHSIDDKGNVMQPAAQGHSPCLTSGCHAEDFMSITKARQTARPGEFRKAATLCLGCHSEVPWPWKPGKTLILDSWRNQREHHIEMSKTGNPARGMDHYDHITIAKTKDGKGLVCRDCHVVDGEFKLATHTPGHAQCQKCHSANNTAFPIVECGRCHKSGPREDWLKGVIAAAGVKVKSDDIDSTRPGTSVRACGSQGSTTADKKFKRKTPCFKHETSGHRMKNDNTDVQCKQCHHMIADEKNWNGRTFRNIADLHTNKIIGTGGVDVTKVSKCSGQKDVNDAQHAACSGGTACHEHEQAVDLSCAKKNCMLCHAQRTNNEAF